MSTKDKLIASAQKNLEKGNINKAIKDYQELLQLEPKSDQYKQKLADLFCRANLKSDALPLYESLAKNYAERGFAAKAVAVYKQMQRIDSSNPDIYLRLAELNRSLGLIGNAMAEYRSLLDFYEKRNMAVDSANLLQKMIDLEPDNINLQLRVLQILIKEKLYDKAKETIFNACQACIKGGDEAKSQKILRSILPHLPGNNEITTSLAFKFSEHSLDSEAIIVLNFLLQRSPQDSSLLEELSTLYVKTNDTNNGILILKKLIEIAPTSDFAERLIRLFLHSRDFDQALDSLQKYEMLLDDETHSLLIELYQELETHLPGNQQVRSAIVRFFGGDFTPVGEPESKLEASLHNDPEFGETSGDFTFGDVEYELSSFLNPVLHEDEVTSIPKEDSFQEVPLVIDVPEEELAEVMIDLPDEEITLDIGEILDSEDEFFKGADDEEGSSSLIDVDYDFSDTDEIEQGQEELLESGFEIELEGNDSLASDVELSLDTPLFDVESVDFTVEEEAETPVGDELHSFLDSVEMDLPPGVEVASLDEEAVVEEEVFEEGEFEDEEILELEPLEELEPVDEEDLAEIEEEPGKTLFEEESFLPPLNDIDLGDELEELAKLLQTEMEDSPIDAPLPYEAPRDEPVMQGPLQEELSANSPSEESAIETLAPVDDDFFDLAAELLDDGAFQATEGLANVGEIDRFRFDSVFSEFKKGVEAQIDNEDTEAHYDLGIAYKEMGLMDDAIEEFKKSMLNPKRLADSLTLIGICHAEKGSFADAEIIFSAAIARSEIEENDKIGLQYELGLVYEVWGRPDKAFLTFSAVARIDPSFRNVGEKIEALRPLVSSGSGDSGIDPQGAASPGKDRVSFV